MLSRRPPPGSPEGRDDDGDKTRKSTSHLRRFAARLLNFRLENHHMGHPLTISLILLLLLVACLLVLDLSRPAVCIFSGGHTSLFSPGSDGLASNFGSLGVPWCRSKQGKTVDWTTKDLLKGLEEFVPIYETRPIKNNVHGMGFDHSFGLWFITRWLKPDLMIESGAFKGHSTWVLRQAMPNKPIISISPRHPEKYLKKEPAYVDGNCTYLAGKNFVDFGSVEWDSVLKEKGILDRRRVLIFFDDHQSELKRLKQALKAGFHHLIFEDNYDTGTGDHYSLRQICDQSYIRGGGHSCIRDSDEARIRMKRKMFWEKAVDTDELCGHGEAWWGVRGEMRDDFNHSNKAITYAEHVQNSRFVELVLDVYWELPPIAGPSLTHQTRYDPARAPDPIIEDGRYGLFRRVGLSRLENSVFNGYTQMVYVQISSASNS